jgi:hypothetical protein
LRRKFSSGRKQFLRQKLPFCERLSLVQISHFVRKNDWAGNYHLMRRIFVWEGGLSAIIEK